MYGRRCSPGMEHYRIACMFDARLHHTAAVGKLRKGARGGGQRRLHQGVRRGGGGDKKGPQERRPGELDLTTQSVKLTADVFVALWTGI